MRLLVFAALIAAASTAVVPYYKKEGGEALKNSYILELKEGIDARAFADRLKATTGVTVKYVYTHALNGLSIETTDLMSVRNFDEIKYVEDNMVAHTLVEWGMDRIDQRYLPLDGQMHLYGSGNGAHIYIVDSGINYNHAEFGGRASYFWDFENGDGSDCDGHGTHCAGTAAGSSVGIAPLAKIWSVRVLDCFGYGTTDGIIMGLDMIIAWGENSVKSVVSMSVGYDVVVTAVDNAVLNTINSGYTVVVAAGNSNQRACRESPASVGEAITVAATDSADVRASFSNHGGCVDIFAPGVGVRSAIHTCNTCYAYFDGTSMATPHVSGVAAVHLGAGSCYNNNSCKSRIIGDATSGVVGNRGLFSPNLLLYCA